MAPDARLRDERRCGGVAARSEGLGRAAMTDIDELTRAVGARSDVPSRSPWIAQLAPDGPPRPLRSDAETDVLIVGAGIAGVATAFFVLRDSSMRVLLVERDRVGRGATGATPGS
jgi:hypothetical protein